MSIHQIVSEAEAEAAEAAITADMQRYGLDAADKLDRFVMARLMELAIVPMPCDDSSLH